METTQRPTRQNPRRTGFGPSPYAQGYRHTFNGGSPLDAWPEDFTDGQAEAWCRGADAGRRDYERDGSYGERATERV